MARGCADPRSGNTGGLVAWPGEGGQPPPPAELAGRGPLWTQACAHTVQGMPETWRSPWTRFPFLSLCIKPRAALLAAPSPYLPIQPLLHRGRALGWGPCTLCAFPPSALASWGPGRAQSPPAAPLSSRIPIPVPGLSLPPQTWRGLPGDLGHAGGCASGEYRAPEREGHGHSPVPASTCLESLPRRRPAPAGVGLLRGSFPLGRFSCVSRCSGGGCILTEGGHCARSVHA